MPARCFFCLFLFTVPDRTRHRPRMLTRAGHHELKPLLGCQRWYTGGACRSQTVACPRDGKRKVHPDKRARKRAGLQCERCRQPRHAKPQQERQRISQPMPDRTTGQDCETPELDGSRADPTAVGVRMTWLPADDRWPRGGRRSGQVFQAGATPRAVRVRRPGRRAQEQPMSQRAKLSWTRTESSAPPGGGRPGRGRWWYRNGEPSEIGCRSSRW